MATKPQFIVLCGPTGVGKSRAPEEIFGLDKGTYTKIEIDSLIVQNKVYREKIIDLLSREKQSITDTIHGINLDKKQEITDLFNTLYFNVKNNTVPCLENENSKTLNCSQLHDKMLADAIEQNKTIVLEINGDKPYDWIVDDVDDTTDLFRNAHRKKLREEYEITICYLSHPRDELIASNRKRFLDNIEECTADKCDVRLGNFLLASVYDNTIRAIFTTYNELVEAQFFKPPIKVTFYKRKTGDTGGGYVQLKDFGRYKESFNYLALHSLSNTKPTRWPSQETRYGPTLQRDTGAKTADTKSAGGRKKQKAKSKKQKAKSKKQKAKNKKQKTKKYKKPKLK